MAKGANNPPSFQCCTCTYGFNLDWSKTNLKKIFKLEEESSCNTSSTTAPSSTVISSSTYLNYTSSSFSASSLHASTYGSYSAYTKPPSMGYPAVPQYGYPAPAPLMTQPMTRIISVPPMGGMAPQPYGAAPIPYAGAPLQPYPGMPPQPYGPAGPLVGPPQHFPGVPPNQFGPIPAGNMPPGVPSMSAFPARLGAPIYGLQPPGNMNFRGTTGPGSIPGVMPVSVSGQTPGAYPVPLQPLGAYPGPVPVQGPGPYPVPQGLTAFPGNPHNLMPGPRLRVPSARLRGRNNKNLKGKRKEKQVNRENHGSIEAQEQWSQDVGESQDNDGEEDTHEDLYDPEAATRFEELLNKIDDHEDEEGDNEDEKPPGEDSQAEFEVAAFTPEEKLIEPAKDIVKNIDNSGGSVEKAAPESESSNTEPEAMQKNTSTVTVNNASEATVVHEPSKVCEDTSVAGNASQDDDIQSGVSSEVESGGLESSPQTAPPPRGKSARGRKRQASGGKKTARNTRTKKVVEDAGCEDGTENDNNGLTGADEVKKAKLSDEQTQENADADESIQDAAAIEDTQPKRVTRARTQRRKK